MKPHIKRVLHPEGLGGYVWRLRYPSGFAIYRLLLRNLNRDNFMGAG